MNNEQKANAVINQMQSRITELEADIKRKDEALNVIRIKSSHIDSLTGEAIYKIAEQALKQ